jgi:YYY domain-containing protein
MKEALTFWFAASLVGAAALPLAFAFFSRLPDRGYAFSRIVGLLLLGYALWIGASVGLFPNSRGTVILLLSLLAIASLVAVSRQREAFIAYVRAGWRYIVFVELLFAAVFAAAVFLRSFVPEIQGGEKQFELAFLSSLARNPTYPPEDPWLSGSPISYYYFGYLMMASLTNLSGLGTNYTFFLSLSLVAAMAATAVFGVVYNLIASTRAGGGLSLPRGPRLPPRAVVFGLAGVGLLLVVSNLEGLFELMARHGVGSQGFYDGLGIYGLSGPYDCGSSPGNCEEWYPTRHMWWWWATRMGSEWDVQEFPFFSFHFGDLHPHVIALPFVITAVGIAFQMLRSEERLDAGWPLQHPWRFLFVATFIGGLGFLNLWDLPTFFLLVVAAGFVANWLRRRNLSWRTLLDTLGFVVPLGGLAALMYLPFYITFDTGTGGLQPVEAAFRPEFAPLDSTVTRPLHMLLFWAPLLWLALPFALSRLLLRGDPSLDGSRGLAAILPWSAPLALWAGWVMARQGPAGLAEEIDARGTSLVTVAMLTAAVAAVSFAFAQELGRVHGDEGTRRSYLFGLLTLGGAAMLLLGTEMFFVDDVNGFRPNTVFKLWYQAWMLLAVSGAFALYHLTRGMRLPGPAFRRPGVPSAAVIARAAWAIGGTAVIVAALVYTVTATMERTGGFDNDQGIDGLSRLRREHPGEYEAIAWLNRNVEGVPVLLEAVGRSYSGAARVSARTGLPTVLGWPRHERLWRSSEAPLGDRESDVERIYGTLDLDEARELLHEYGVEYVYVGPLERDTYDPLDEEPQRLEKFGRFMDVAYENGEVTIYRMPEREAALARAGR